MEVNTMNADPTATMEQLDLAQCLQYWIPKFISYLSYLLHCCTLPDKRCLSHGMCLYQVMMTLHFLNDVANDA